MDAECRIDPNVAFKCSSIVREADRLSPHLISGRLERMKPNFLCQVPLIAHSEGTKMYCFQQDSEVKGAIYDYCQ